MERTKEKQCDIKCGVVKEAGPRTMARTVGFVAVWSLRPRSFRNAYSLIPCGDDASSSASALASGLGPDYPSSRYPAPVSPCHLACPGSALWTTTVHFWTLSRMSERAALAFRLPFAAGVPEGLTHVGGGLQRGGRSRHLRQSFQCGHLAAGVLLAALVKLLGVRLRIGGTGLRRASAQHLCLVNEGVPSLALAIQPIKNLDLQRNRLGHLELKGRLGRGLHTSVCSSARRCLRTSCAIVLQARARAFSAFKATPPVGAQPGYTCKRMPSAR
eukprot:scaffold1696_cov258-Pinguiococcus_pyrenoidosus.AAC.19